MTHLSGFGDALLYIALFALLIPLANIVLIPVLAVLIHGGKLEQSAWRKFLVINGLVSLVPTCFFWVVVLKKYIQIDTPNFFSLNNFASYVFPYIGYVLQATFVVVWLVYIFRKKTLPNRYYKAWGWVFALFFLLPYAIYLILVVASAIQRNVG